MKILYVTGCLGFIGLVFGSEICDVEFAQTLNPKP